ncbi:MAG: serine hydrolase [Candidatus Sericytochromatia bacterium]|nr:serine hydrolase [Candidatus Sericytochromatia bacterium]
MRINLRFWSRPTSLAAGQPKPPVPPPVPSTPGMAPDQRVPSQEAPGLPSVVTDARLEAALLASARRHGLKDAGIVLLDLNGRRVAAMNGDKAFSAASVIKLPLMAAVMQGVEAGTLSLDQLVTIKAQNQTGTWLPEGDRRPLLRPGMKVPIARLLELMISRSDNVATNNLMDLVSREDLAKGFADFGAPNTRLVRKLSAGRTVSDPDYQGGRNETTARDMQALMERLSEEKLVSPDASARMKTWLGLQWDRDKLPSGLPKGVKVYSKTGETSKVTHDVMLAESDSQRYILVVLTALPPGGNTWRRMGAFSRDMWNALEPAKSPPQATPSSGG